MGMQDAHAHRTRFFLHTSITIAIFTALAGANVPAVGEILFEDDFEAGLSNAWTVGDPDCTSANAHWSVVDGELRQYIEGCNQCSALVVGDHAWSNYLFSADIRLEQGTQRDIYVNWVDRYHSLQVNLNSWEDPDGKAIVFAGGHRIAEIPYPLVTGQSNHLRFGMVHGTVILEVDGNRLLELNAEEWIDSGDIPRSGPSAIVAWAGGACRTQLLYFDNVRVEAFALDPVDAVELEIGRAQGSAGESVMVPVAARTVGSTSGDAWIALAGLDMELRWDPELAEMTEIELGEAAGAFQIVSDIRVGTASLSMASVDGVALNEIDTEMLRLHFRFAELASGLTLLEFVSLSAFTPKPAPIVIRGIPGQLRLDCPRGDVLADGRINSGDAILALRISVGLVDPSPLQLCAADMDDDGEVTVADAILILRAAAGLDRRPPLAAAPDARGRWVTLRSDEAGQLLSIECGGIAGLELVAVLPEDAWPAQVELTSGANALLESRFVGRTLHIALAATTSDQRTIELRTEGSGVQAEEVLIERLRAFDRDGTQVEIALEQTNQRPEIVLGTQPRIVGVVPNPFNPRTVVSFELPSGGPARLEIVDLAGRLVARLFDGELGQGRHHRDWNGVDDTGHAVASGVYFAVLQAEMETATEKIVLLR